MLEYLALLAKPLTYATKTMYGYVQEKKRNSRKSEPNTLADSGNEKSANLVVKMEHGNKTIITISL